jgi:hypothetical protein
MVVGRSNKEDKGSSNIVVIGLRLPVVLLRRKKADDDDDDDDDAVDCTLFPGTGRNPRNKMKATTSSLPIQIQHSSVLGYRCCRSGQNRIWTSSSLHRCQQ